MSVCVVTNVRTSDTLELDIDVESLKPQDSGAKEAGSVELDLYDGALAFELLPEDEITVSTVASPSDILFGGHIRSLDTEVIAIGRKYHLIAYDYSTLLDRINVVQVDRPAGESDHDRLAWFMTTFGSGLLDDDPAGIATLNASMPAQKFRLITLRQAIEQVLGTALATGTYRLNSSKKLDTWDSDPGLEAAPFDVVIGTPGVGEIAPESLAITGDTSELYNAYWVRGATAAGSGWFTDPASIAAWGRREKYIDAPDSDLSWKAFNVGMAALADTKEPKYRGTFTVYDGDWRSNQRFALTSPIHGPAGGFTAEPFDTVRITRRYLSGTAVEVYDVEFGSPKGSFAAKHGKNARRADGVGPGSGGWGPGGGLGGGSGSQDCGCGPFEDTCPFHTFDDMNRTNGSVWGTTSSASGAWSGSKTGDADPSHLSVLVDSIVPTHGIMKVTNPGGPWFATAEERIPGPGAWSTGDWKIKTSVEVANTNVSGWGISVGPYTLGWSRPSALLILTANGPTTLQAAAGAVFDGMGFIDIEIRLAGSTLTAIVAGMQFSALTEMPLPAGYDPDLNFNMGGLAAAVGGAEVHFGRISIADCVSVPSAGQQVDEITTSDGVSTTGTTNHPYSHGSLQLVSRGTNVTDEVTEVDSTVGSYSTANPMPAGSLRRYYLGAE